MDSLHIDFLSIGLDMILMGLPLTGTSLHPCTIQYRCRDEATSTVRRMFRSCLLAVFFTAFSTAQRREGIREDIDDQIHSR